MEPELSELEKLINYARTKWGTKAFSLMSLTEIEGLVSASAKEVTKVNNENKLDVIAEEGSN